MPETGEGGGEVSDVFRKLQLKDQDRILVVGAPEEFRTHVKGLSATTKVATIARGNGLLA